MRHGKRWWQGGIPGHQRWIQKAGQNELRRRLCAGYLHAAGSSVVYQGAWVHTRLGHCTLQQRKTVSAKTTCDTAIHNSSVKKMWTINHVKLKYRRRKLGMVCYSGWVQILSGGSTTVVSMVRRAYSYFLSLNCSFSDVWMTWPCNPLFSPGFIQVNVFLIRYVTDGTVAILMSALFFCIPSNLPRCCGKSRDGRSTGTFLIIFYV